MVLLGPPGCGKGTQAARLREKFGVVHISTGDILRDAIVKGSELGREAKSYIDKGELVPDAVVCGIVEDRLRKPDCARGFLLDGFPRTESQAERLDGFLSDNRISLSVVIDMEVDEAELVKRLSSRRVCDRCHTVYNVITSAPRRNGVCDYCGWPVVHRDDDKEETIKNRLRVYRDKTMPLLDYYKRKGILRRVVALGPADEIAGHILRELETSNGWQIENCKL